MGTWIGDLDALRDSDACDELWVCCTACSTTRGLICELLKAWDCIDGIVRWSAAELECDMQAGLDEWTSCELRLAEEMLGDFASLAGDTDERGMIRCAAIWRWVYAIMNDAAETDQLVASVGFAGAVGSVPVTSWVLALACRQFEDYNEDHNNAEPVRGETGF